MWIIKTDYIPWLFIEVIIKNIENKFIRQFYFLPLFGGVKNIFTVSKDEWKIEGEYIKINRR